MVAGGPRVVLVEPQIAANLGFCARALANFGLADWVQVGGVEWRGSEAERTGAPALEVLAGLRRAADLEEGVGECSHVIGFTARGGRERPLTPLPEMGRVLREWGSAARVALVFGREDRGLETEEIQLCTELMRIPTPDGALASLNLSHALGIGLYQWWCAQGDFEAHPTDPADPTLPADPAVAPEPNWSDLDDRLRLARKTEEELRASGFRYESELLQGTLRRVCALPLQARDVRQLERILRHVRWLREGQDVELSPAHKRK